MKIIVIAGLFPARSETFIKEHAIGLAKRGHHITVISCGAGEGIQPSEILEIEKTGVKTICIPDFKGSQVKCFFQFLIVIFSDPRMIQYVFGSHPWTSREMFRSYKIWQHIQQIDPDVTHIHFGSIAGPTVRYKLPRRAVVTWHGYDANHVPNFRGKAMYKHLFDAPLYHTVGSLFMQKKLQSLGASAKNITQIPMGINPNFFTYKKRIFSKKNPLKIISIGRLCEVKGHTFLIQAVSELINEGENIRLRIIGDGLLFDELSKQISGSQTSSSIQLLGAKRSDEILSELHASDLFCLTGIESSTGQVETQGLVFAEAQSTGLPVIGSSAGGVPDSLIDGHTGFLCPPKDIDAIKKAIKFFLISQNSIDKFGKKGRELIESKFTLDKMLDNFENIYNLVIKDIDFRYKE